jgi:hypothetical protein
VAIYNSTMFEIATGVAFGNRAMTDRDGTYPIHIFYYTYVTRKYILIITIFVKGLRYYE